jgi:hypothetical protein
LARKPTPFRWVFCLGLLRGVLPHNVIARSVACCIAGCGVVCFLARALPNTQ